MVDEQLGAVDRQLEALENASIQDTQTKAESIESKFPQYVKDGKMNTKQVLDLLQVQDKQVEKVGGGTKNRKEGTQCTLCDV